MFGVSLPLETIDLHGRHTVYLIQRHRKLCIILWVSTFRFSLIVLDIIQRIVLLSILFVLCLFLENGTNDTQNETLLQTQGARNVRCLLEDMDKVCVCGGGVPNIQTFMYEMHSHHDVYVVVIVCFACETKELLKSKGWWLKPCSGAELL